MVDSGSLNDELSALQDGSLTLSEDVQINLMRPEQVIKLFQELIEAITLHPKTIDTGDWYDILKSIIRDVEELTTAATSKLFDIVCSAFKNLISQLTYDMENNVQVYSYSKSITKFTFLVYMLLVNSEQSLKTNKLNKPTKNKPLRGPAKDMKFYPVYQAKILELMFKVLKLPLDRIFTTNDSEALASCYMKSMFIFIENPDNLKNIDFKTKVYHILALTAKKHSISFSIQTTILQNLQYYDNVSETMAEILATMINEHDYPNLAEEILREISQKDFVSTDKIGPKSYSTFIVKLCQLSPKVIQKQIGLLIKHLDSEAYQIRCGIVEVIGLLVHESIKEQNETNEKQLERYFEIIEERFKDIYFLVRCRVLQVCGRIAEMKAKFPKQRPRLIHLIIKRLEDKSNFVRKNAVKSLTKFLQTHPYAIDGGKLSYDNFKTKYTIVLDKLNELQEKQQQMLTMEQTEGMEQVLNENDNGAFLQLQMKQKYYEDGLYFIDQIKGSLPILIQLLASKSKSEAIEAMDFFVEAYLYDIKEAKEGLKKMIHLIWNKDNTDEGKGIQKHLKNCFSTLYLTPPFNSSSKEGINHVAKNLINLTLEANLADLISLQELMIVLTKDNLISDDVIDKLWGIYGYIKKEIDQKQRRGAIIVLTMIGQSMPIIISENLDLLMSIGLGDIGKQDLEIAKYTCMAIQCLGSSKIKKVKGSVEVNKRFENSEPLFDLLTNIVEVQTYSHAWFSMTEAAITAIYDLAQRPDLICEAIVQSLLSQLSVCQVEDTSDPWQLIKLIFLVGHIAIKQIVFLEIVEADQKRIKANISNDGDLENIGASNEDYITEMFHKIREEELLYHSNALLKKFSPLVVEVCTKNNQYNDPTLQTIATLTLSKFMCVSSTFCETHLNLLLTILEKSEAPIVRSNIMISLGDIAASFNSLIGENMNYMYSRLHDKIPTVKKNTLMVLTHLVLNGMVKVKGQLAEMAKCIVDTDLKIQNLAKLFFSELATKDNAVYNNLPDIISHLSGDSDGSLPFDDFKIIMKFLMDFIKDKEKHCESVVDKLCHRFKNLKRQQQFYDISYCLSLIPYRTERTFGKLVSNFQFYSTHLNDKIVYGFFHDILSKTKQFTTQKADLKNLIDEFEAKLEKAKETVDSDPEDNFDGNEEVDNVEEIDDIDKESQNSDHLGLETQAVSETRTQVITETQMEAEDDLDEDDLM